jgi:hypothetical protein
MIKIFIFFIVLTISSQSFAFYFFEPFVGHQVDYQRYDISNNKNILIADQTSFRTNGLIYGVRAGAYLFGNIGIGVDYKNGSLSGSGQGISFNEPAIQRKVSENILYGTVVYRFYENSPFRFLLGAAISGKQVDSGSYNYKGESTIQALKSFKVGMSYFFSTTVNFSLDLEFLQTTKSKDIEQGTTSASQYSTVYLKNPTSSGNMTNAIISLGLNLF